MKVLILNSGMGKRMGKLTNNRPKCMTCISGNGDTILSRQLKIIQKYGIRDVIITTGPFATDLLNYCNELNLDLNIKFVYNPIYAKSNYIYSIYEAREHLASDIILMHGDLVFAEEVFKKILQSEISCVVTSTRKALPKKDFKAVINCYNGIEKVDKIGVDFFESAVAAQPLYKILQREWKVWLDKIIEFCENGVINCYAENAFNELKGECSIYPVDVEYDLCEEVDNIEDLIKICTILGEQKYSKEIRSIYEEKNI